MENKNNNFVFETESVLNDTVILTQENFLNHIILHHPEMLGHENDIEETVKNPNFIYKAKRFPDIRNHFVRKTNKNEISEYNNVIVEYDSEQNGYVKTSYYSENLERGGDYVYVRYNNKI
ncbi:MAG: hypothetical protein IJH39_09820 [Clostridia bacterium]|nr:hypothetical protein [Clostridia bacterium]